MNSKSCYASLKWVTWFFLPERGSRLGRRTRSGTDPPLGAELARILAKECRWAYNDDDLPTVYDQAQKHLGSKELEQVLARYYRDCKPADWHLRLPSLRWYRIYTTNIDDVLEQAYKDPAGPTPRPYHMPRPLHRPRPVVRAGAVRAPPRFHPRAREGVHIYL